MATRVTDIENALWNAADQLRANSNLSAQEYSFPVLGLIFLRYADVKFSKAEAELKANAGSSRRRGVSKLDYQATTRASKNCSNCPRAPTWAWPSTKL